MDYWMIGLKTGNCVELVFVVVLVIVIDLIPCRQFGGALEDGEWMSSVGCRVSGDA
jgi:hypothetical protein